MNKKTIFSIVALAILGVAIMVPKSTYAFWPFDGLMKNSQSQNQTGSVFPPIIQKIIDKFGLNKDEVQKVIDEDRDERQNQMKAKFEERLSDAVKLGKLSQEQKDKIIAKYEEMYKNQKEWQSLTPAEKRRKSFEWNEEMRKFMENEGINLGDMFGFGMGFGMGMK